MLIIDYIQIGILDKMDTSVEVVEVGPVVNGAQIVKFKCLRWMKLFDKIFVDGNEVYILEFGVAFVKLDIPNPAGAVRLDSIVKLKTPLLLNGTLSNTKEEWSRFELDERNKLPFVWLVSPTYTTKANKQTSLVKADVDLWFVHWSDWSKLNKDRQDEALRPLYVLLKEFNQAIEKNLTDFDGYDGLNIGDYPKFGKRDSNGIEKTLFDSTLSAIHVQMKLNVRAKKCINC